MHLRIKFKDNFKLKAKLIKAELSILDKSRNTFFSFQMQFKVLNSSNYSGFNYIVQQSKSLKQSSSRDFFYFAFKEEHKKWEGLPFNN